MLTHRPRTARLLVLPTSTPGPRVRKSTDCGLRLDPTPIVMAPAILVALLAVLPLGYLVVRAAEAGPHIWPFIARPATLRVLGNTAILAVAVAVSACVIAVPFAWLTIRTDLPMRRFWATAIALPLVIPSYVGALAFVSALGPKGLLQQSLEPLGVERLPSIYGFWGSWLVLTLFTYPYVYLSVGAALRGLDPGLDEAARGLGVGPWRSFLRTTLPQLRPAMAFGALLAALYTIGDFGVVALLRYDAFTRAIYVQYRTALDRSSAAVLALMLVGLALVLLAVESRVRGRATPTRVGLGSARRPRIVRLGHWQLPALVLCAACVISAVGLPLAVMLYWAVRSSEQTSSLIALGTAVAHSLQLAIAAALISTIAALPVAILRVRQLRRSSQSLDDPRRRANRPQPAAWIERACFLGYALPGIVVALAFVALGAQTPLHQTLALLVLACAVRFLPEAVGAARVSLLQVGPRLEEAARCLGTSPTRTMLRVTLPLARTGILAGAGLVVLTTLKELPVTLLLSPTGFETLATEIWSAAGDAAYGRAALPALVLIGVSAVPTLLLARREPMSAS